MDDLAYNSFGSAHTVTLPRSPGVFAGPVFGAAGASNLLLFLFTIPACIRLGLGGALSSSGERGDFGRMLLPPNWVCGGLLLRPDLFGLFGCAYTGSSSSSGDFFGRGCGCGGACVGRLPLPSGAPGAARFGCGRIPAIGTPPGGADRSYGLVVPRDSERGFGTGCVSPAAPPRAAAFVGGLGSIAPGVAYSPSLKIDGSLGSLLAPSIIGMSTGLACSYSFVMVARPDGCEKALGPKLGWARGESFPLLLTGWKMGDLDCEFRFL